MAHRQRFGAPRSHRVPDLRPWGHGCSLKGISGIPLGAGLLHPTSALFLVKFEVGTMSAFHHQRRAMELGSINALRDDVSKTRQGLVCNVAPATPPVMPAYVPPGTGNAHALLMAMKPS
jgi:hypothetical protein